MPISKNWDQHVTCWPNSQKKHQRKFISIFIEQYLKVTCRSQKIEINMWLVGPTRKKKHQQKFISIFIKQYWKVTCRSQKIEINMWLVGPTRKKTSMKIHFNFYWAIPEGHMPISKNWDQHVTCWPNFKKLKSACDLFVSHVDFKKLKSTCDLFVSHADFGFLLKSCWLCDRRPPRHTTSGPRDASDAFWALVSFFYFLFIFFYTTDNLSIRLMTTLTRTSPDEVWALGDSFSFPSYSFKY